MSEIIESITLTMLHILLTAVGVFVLILVLRVYDLYRTMKVNKSVMTPMLVAGVFIAS